jgi:hypothetical protein
VQFASYLYCANPISDFAQTDLLKGSPKMFDLILLAMGLGMFALSIAYAYACDRL